MQAESWAVGTGSAMVIGSRLVVKTNGANRDRDDARWATRDDNC